MLRRNALWLSKRTPGYVFWRQGSLTELEHSKRNYLLSERPVPLGEISRRMARVKARYEDTRDFHERNLLRGEYKYFTGKLCDLRAARFGDMVVVLQCAAFFGFWDAAQVDRLLAELFLQLESLEAVELVALFACMPQLRRQESELYRRVAGELVPLVAELTTQECLEVCRACTAETPFELTEQVLRELTAHLDELTPAQCVEVLDTWSVAPEATQMRTHEAVDAVRQHVLRHLEELDCMDVAVLYTSLQAGSSHDELPEALQLRLVHAFTRDLTHTCPRSTAMLFTAATTRGSHAVALELAQTMSDRVLFLSTDFTPPELLAVFQVYLDGLVSVHVLSTEMRAASADHPSTDPLLPASASGLLQKTTAVVRAPASALARQQMLEREYAAQNAAVLQHVCEGLSEQLVVMVESASAYVSAASQMELVELYASAVEQLEASASAGDASAMTELLRLLPASRRVLQLVSGKLVASMKTTSVAQLLQLLELANSLGNAALQDAVVASAVQELLTRDTSGLTTESAMALEQRLRSLTQLRAEHQRRLTTALLPKVRRYI